MKSIGYFVRLLVSAIMGGIVGSLLMSLSLGLIWSISPGSIVANWSMLFGILIGAIAGIRLLNLILK